MDEKKKAAFLEEYKELCERHELFVSRESYSDGRFYVASIDCGLPMTPRLWFDEQLTELRQIHRKQ